mgnify:CR=1 FL=1
MCEDKNVRIVIKQGSGVPTIPVSADHRNGDWLTTDIYEGEQYQDTDSGVIYSRTVAGIVPIGGGSLSGAISKTYVELSAIITAGTLTPSIRYLISDRDIIVTAYSSTQLETYGSRKMRIVKNTYYTCLLYTSPSPRDRQKSRMPSSA